MKYATLLFLLILLGRSARAQENTGPAEVTPAIEKKIQQEITKETEQLKATLKKNNELGIAIEFTVDTFRIERYMISYMDYDWSTLGTTTAMYNAAKSYDSLLNKYYKKLSGVLKPGDKTILQNTQKTWIAFRDNEVKLIETVSKDEYSGGGTMQQIFDASAYLDIIKSRALAIFSHYMRATQSY